jgi:CubicO group peptidase (beta-lactamase class C family)
VGYTEMPVFGATIRNPYNPAEFVDACFSKLELLFEPGTRFSYSNSGYFLLGVILERITGESYEKLLRDRIFAPLGMNDSGYDPHNHCSRNVPPDTTNDSTVPT